jgi:hypothetical protein
MKKHNGRPVRRLAERLFLGSIMTVMAVLLDRRLRRVFAKDKAAR